MRLSQRESIKHAACHVINKMATPTVSFQLVQCMQCLKCQVMKFKNKIDLSNIVSVNLSLHGFISFQNKDRFTSVLRLNESGIINVSSSNTMSMINNEKWTKSKIFWDTRAVLPDWSHTFFIQDENHTVIEYAVTSDSVTLKKQLPIQPLQRAIESFSNCTVSTVKLIGYDRGYLLFLVNSDTLCAAEIVDNVCVPCTWIPLPSEEVALGNQGLSCFQISSDAVAVLHRQAQLLFIYNLSDGKLLCQMDLEPAGFCFSEAGGNDASVSHCGWTMSASLNRLVWINPNRTISILDLERYITSNPNSVILADIMQLSRSKVGISQTVHTSRRGGFSWKQALLKLHQLEVSQTLSTSWSPGKIPAKASLEKNSSTIRQTPACSFRGKRQEVVDGTTKTWMKHFQFPKGSLLEVGYRVSALQCARYTLAMVLVSEVDGNQRAVCLVDVKTAQVYFQCLPIDHFALTMDLPMMILSPDGLLVLFPPSEIQQDDIVSKVMVHSNSATADNICQLNSWGRTTVPLHAIEQGLRQLQLHTVSFFLSSKEHLFSGMIGDKTGTNQWIPDTHISTIRDVLPALDLFLKVMNDNLPDMSPPRDFCLRLLVLTLEFVHSLLKDGMVRLSQLGRTKEEASEKEDLDKAIEGILGYIAKLRDTITALDVKQKCQKQSVKHRSQSLRSAGSGSVDTETWDSASVGEDNLHACNFGVPDTELVIPEDFVEKACREGNIPQLQSEMFVLGHKISAQWGQVVQAGLQRAWSHVQERDITAAQTLISSLGLDVAGTLWQLVQYTINRPLQDFVIEQLKAAAALSTEDRALVEFLYKVYFLYPSTSAKQCFLKKHGRLTWSEQNPFASHLRKIPTNVATEATDIAPIVASSTGNESNEISYCVMAIHWLKHMDAQMKEAILIDGAILNDEITVDTTKFSPRLLWQYWLSRNEPQRAIEALEAALSDEKRLLGSCLAEYLNDLPLSASFVQHMVKCHLLCNKDRLWPTIDSLHLSPEERIGFVPRLFNAPHPLLHFGAKVMEQFHRLFAAYCVHHGFGLALWKYCSTHGLMAEKLLDIESAVHVQWFKPFIFFHSAINQTDDASRMFAASLSMASLVWKPDDWTLAHLLKMGHVTTAIATMAYMPEIDSIFQAGNASVHGIDAELLRTSLQRFPKLLSALLPPDADTSRFDINLYQLLRDSAPLDTRRLFGWQSTNTLAVGTEDGMKVLPYFSHPDLVSHFAHTAKLDFTYYLKHGRPSYAFLSFTSEELQHKTNTLSPKRVNSACGVALWLAVKHFHSTQISSACVAFVEMLGRDSIVLRSYIHAGKTLLAHRVRTYTGSTERRKEHHKAGEQDVVSLLHSCLGRRRDVGLQMLVQLEDAIADEVAKEGLSSTSVEAALKWNLHVLLCHHLRLPMSTRFLESCARDDLWLPFIWFAQLHQYPKSQLQLLLHQFPSCHLRDHLHYIITNASSNTVTTTSTAAAYDKARGMTTDGSKGVRTSLYSRIGVRGTIGKGEISSDEEEVVEEHTTEQQVQGERLHTDEELDVTEESSASDVFRVIFSAMATSDPWKSLLMHAVVLRNPLFAELAGCCGAPMVCSICGWLVAMLAPSEHAHFLGNHGKRAFLWTKSHLEELIKVYLQCHAENTLSAAFFIFQPTSPLLPFMQFIAQCVSWRNYEGCKQLLDKFKDDMAHVGLDKSSSSRDRTKEPGNQQPSADRSREVIGDRSWLEQTAYTVLQFELLDCPSLYDAVHLLQLLAEENIALVFSFDVLDFGHLHRMVEILHKHRVTEVNLPQLLSAVPERQGYLDECQKALESLMRMEVYEDAYTFGQRAGLDLSAVVLQHLGSEKQQLESLGMWTSATLRRCYWKQCGARCARFHLPPQLVTQFFLKEAERTNILSEKATIFQLSLNHIESHQDQMKAEMFQALRNETFTCMWRCRIQDRVAGRRTNAIHDKREIQDIFSSLGDEDTTTKKAVSREELLHKAAYPILEVDSADELSSEECAELEIVMGELLSESRVSECCQLARLLGGQSAELHVILTCIGLSTGEITAATMDVLSRRLLTTAEKRASLASVASFARGASSLSLARVAPDWGFLPSAQEEVIALMERLLCQCRQARPCCLRIVSVYKIACLTGRSYREVLLAGEFSVLRTLLKAEFAQRYSLAADFLSTSSLTDAEVASFLVDEIVKSLRIYLGGKDSFDVGMVSNSGTTELIFRPTEGGEVFSQLVSLCGDPAILGDKLLYALATLAAAGASDVTQSVLSMVTELLIMSHECHTAACNMEGISNVLRAARVCAQHLVEANQYQLMIRLLTGIGRYSEMTYIFDYLHQHQQFEMLLRKGIDREDKLKTAILDYLKRFHLDDKDTYSMVALNFSMYREIAQMLEDSGHYNLNLLKDKPVDSTKEMTDTLKKSHQYFKDAAESYVKDQCYDYTTRCLKWARLVNLQMQFMGSGLKVIHLTPEEVRTFVASHNKFIEAFMVVDAHGTAVDWSESLFTHVILGADMRYLEDFKRYLKLTPNLIESTLLKMKLVPGKMAGCTPQIRKLLKMCSDVWLEYKIAQDLGLQDFTKELLRDDFTGGYIKDMLNYPSTPV